MTVPLDIACRYFYYKPMAAFFNAFHLRALGDAEVRLIAPVLDLGCGNGTFGVVLEEAMRPVPRMTGVDISTKAILRAERLAAHCYDRFCVADAGRLPFDCRAFRTVISNASMVSFCSGVEEATREMFRVLQPGGRICVTLATRAFEENYLFPRLFRAFGLARLAKWSTESMNRRLPHCYAYTPEMWRELFERNGFRVERVTGFFPTSAVGLWSFLAWTPMRVHTLLRFLPVPARRVAGALYRRAFLNRYRNTPAVLDPRESAYILLLASKD